MSLLKTISRKIKRLLIAVLGSKTDEFYWRFRHVFDKEWAKSYISKDAIDHPHRKFLLEKIGNYSPFESVLEIGCSSGPNLYLLAKKYPKIKIYGIDISAKAIEEGKKYFEKENIKNVYLNAGGIEALKIFTDKSIDVVFTDAALIYFDKDKIENAIKEILRVAKKSIVFLEMHYDGLVSVYKDNWIHNYNLLLKNFIKKENIKITKIPPDLWGGNWQKYGHIIEASI